VTKILSLDDLCRVVLDLFVGEWKWQVLKLISYADDENRALLASIYPRDVAFYEGWMALTEPTVAACEALRKRIYGW
jgi:hypothetical protein